MDSRSTGNGKRETGNGRWSLVEVCAGSAALSVHLLGGKHALLPYQGSKWKVRRELEKLLRDHGIVGPPSTVWLNDPGPFGRTWEALVSRPGSVSSLLGEMERLDPRKVYETLQGKHAPIVENNLFAAEHLFLQRLSHSGKAVTLRDGKWCSPGFNKTSAYGTPVTDRFGPVQPMLPHLVKTVRQVGSLFFDIARTTSSLDAKMLSVPDSAFSQRFDEVLGHQGNPVVVLVDPPYSGTTGYAGEPSFNRLELVRFVRALLERAHDRPVLVVVCEAEPVFELMGTGIGDQAFASRVLRDKTDGRSPFRSTATEVATFVGTSSMVSRFPFPVSRASRSTGQEEIDAT